MVAIEDAKNYYAIFRSECKKFLEELRELNVATSQCHYSAKEFIYNRYSSEKNALYVLLDGVVKLYLPYQRDKHLARLVGPWEIFGDLHLLEKGSSEAWVEAFSDCKVTKIPRRSLRQAIEWHPEVALRLATLLESQLVHYEALLEGLCHRETQARLARLLLLLTSRFGESFNSEVPMQINLRLTHQELAEMIASSRESVSTLLNKMRHKKLIEVNNQRVVIFDFEGLAECALLPLASVNERSKESLAPQAAKVSSLPKLEAVR